MSDARTELAAAVERLDALAARLGEDGVAGDELRRLADDAMSASARVTELLPQVIRAIERAAEGAPDEPPA